MTSPPLDRRALLIGSLAGAFTLSLPRAAFSQNEVKRIDALIAKMTIEEKAGQMSCLADSFRPFNPPNPKTGVQDKRRLGEIIRKTGVGSLFNGIGAKGAREAQDIAVRQNRLGIPILFAGDVIHGLRTIFPVPLAEAASFDPTLAERTARAAALEATAAGIHLTYAPVVDVARDQRWGRVVEGAGEDVYLGKLFAAARVKGLQGRNTRRADSLLASPKHFAAYGAVLAGLDYNNVDISDETLRETHLPPFQAAIDAGALALMSSFNEINGVPATADHALMTDLLRGEMGFRGFVCSDFSADQELVAHGFAEDDRDAARLAILAGVDMSMQSGIYLRYIPELVESGAIPMSTIDVAVRRILYVKTAAGLFDDPYRSIDEKAEAIHISSPDKIALSREAGARSIVLLRNEGDLLPLSADSQKRIALIGPFADDKDNILGPWSFYGDVKLNVDIATGLRARMAYPSQLTVERGSGIEAPIRDGIARAVEAAKEAHIVILALGEGADMSGEAESRTEIGIPPAQQALADAVAAVGRPTIVLLRHGRALALQGAISAAPAILATWFLGSQTGHAIADVLFGFVNPSAKLPVSFPWESGQEPFFYDRKSTGRPVVENASTEYRTRFRTTDNTALFPFGHGLGYSDFQLSGLKLSTEKLGWDETLEIEAAIRNTGKVAGAEVVQLYIRDRIASRTRPIRELKGVHRVELAAGDKGKVRFTLKRADLMFVGSDSKWIAEPGLFDIWVSRSSIGGLAGSFRLMAPGAV
ncbi:beta-glucosidase BglX [Sphingomonas naphthae]|uniref:beta-glucosidase n=1 Tax=Sphingomonas naphthae TaxID=1813468 RepID=A0ABY7TNM6_9SPHN|nr:beta-glucosidase BglX [Sphingomonas naphthae]WCT74262.1 beta-glucosidase BglX [Sphingomonas naphthae]